MRSLFRRIAFFLATSFLAVVAVAAFAPAPLHAQQRAAADTSQAAPPSRPDAPAPPSNGQQDLKAPVEFTARDSLVVDLGAKSNGEQGTLYGNAEANYDQATLTAHEIEMHFEGNELHARGLPSDTGLVGRPQFRRGEEDSFYGDEMAYNLRTERGRVVSARTSAPGAEGFVQGEVVKVMEDSTLYLADAAYTTCECEDDPSYSLRADRMKVKDEWVYSGPIRLYLFNIPTPFWLPFGLLPATQGRRSGPLPADYGENELGFYLRNIGWYQALNEYMDLRVTGGIWTSGSWELGSRLRYNKRYEYNGDFSVNFVHQRRGETRDPDFETRNTGRLRWNHKQDFTPNSNLNADVNLTSSGYLRTNAENYEDKIRNTIQSSIRYSNRWPATGRSLQFSASQRQVLATGEVNLTLPRLSFTQSRRKPFEREQRPAGEDEQWYEKITYRYSGSLRNAFSYPSREQRLQAVGDSAVMNIPWYEALVSPSTYRRATGDNVPFDFRVQHRLPVDASFDVTRLFGQPFFLSLSPNLEYREEWYPYRRELRADTAQASSLDPVVEERVTDFTAIRQFSTGLSSSTRFFGLFPLKVGPFEGLRHTVRPSLGFNYQPDFSRPFWGYTDTYRDTSGTQQRYTVVEPGRLNSRLRGQLSLSIDNLFETKKHSAPDSTGERKQSTIQLLNLGVRTNYDLAADSFKLGGISLSARPRFLNRTRVQLSASFSPYAWSETRQREVDQYAWERWRLPRLTHLTLRVGTSFGGQQRGSRQDQLGARQASPSPRPASSLPASYDSFYNEAVYGRGFADFSIPWSLDFDFNYRLDRNRDNELEHDATLNSDFQFNVTPKWKVSGNTGFKFRDLELATTELRIHRDLGCWEMSFNWVPFGRYQQYSFTLQVKSGELRDLLRLNQPRSDVTGRFRGLLN